MNRKKRHRKCHNIFKVVHLHTIAFRGYPFLIFAKYSLQIVWKFKKKKKLNCEFLEAFNKSRFVCVNYLRKCIMEHTQL